jgi:hypothetical protein
MLAGISVNPISTIKAYTARTSASPNIPYHSSQVSYTDSLRNLQTSMPFVVLRICLFHNTRSRLHISILGIESESTAILQCHWHESWVVLPWHSLFRHTMVVGLESLFAMCLRLVSLFQKGYYRTWTNVLWSCRFPLCWELQAALIEMCKYKVIYHGKRSS